MVAIIVTTREDALPCGGCGAALEPPRGAHLWDTVLMLPLCETCAVASAPQLVALVKLGKAEGLIETARRSAKARRDVSTAFETERRTHDATILRDQKRAKG